MNRVPSAAIVLPTDGIGGTEKRLAELWINLRKRSKQRHLLVVSAPLFQHLLAIDDFRPVLEALREDVIVHDVGGKARRAALSRLREGERAEVFHVAMAAPLSLGLVPPTSTVFTVPVVSLGYLNARGRLSVTAGAAFASQVDVLDPNVTAELRKLLPWMAGRIHNTPGSQIDLEAFTGVPFAKKENRVVFCGLLSREKQVHRFLDALPELHQALLAAGVASPSYALLGRDTDEVRAYARVAEFSKAIPVKAWFEPNPAQVLRTARVFLSLQATTNYPSKSLLEAMACGAHAVITDVGDSRLAAREDFASFVPGAFSAADLAGACVRAMKAAPAEGDAAISRARAFLAERFSMDASCAYFENLYARAAG